MNMRTPEDVFEDFCARRSGILRALTTDVDTFFEQCDPNRENLCLYGMSDGSWVVDLPAEEVPPEHPEPALGINFARDGMQRRDWLSLVAVHSDTWLMSVAFYNGVRLNKEGREVLFDLINELPTCYETVSGKANGSHKPSQQQNFKKRPAPAPVPARRPSLPKQPKQHPQQTKPMTKVPNKHVHEDMDEEEPEEEEAGDVEYGDGEGDPCPNCGRIYRQGDFWIQCDFCDTWYDGKCVGMTESKAARFGKWKCPQCVRAERAQ